MNFTKSTHCTKIRLLKIQNLNLFFWGRVTVRTQTPPQWGGRPLPSGEVTYPIHKQNLTSLVDIHFAWRILTICGLHFFYLSFSYYCFRIVFRSVLWTSYIRIYGYGSYLHWLMCCKVAQLNILLSQGSAATDLKWRNLLLKQDHTCHSSALLCTSVKLSEQKKRRPETNKGGKRYKERI